MSWGKLPVGLTIRHSAVYSLLEFISAAAVEMRKHGCANILGSLGRGRLTSNAMLL